MSIHEAINHAVSKVESAIEEYTQGFAAEHHLINYGGDKHYAQMIHATAASLDKMLQFRAYLKGYSDSPVDSGLFFHSVMKYNAIEYLNGWKNYRDVMNMLADDEFMSHPEGQMARLASTNVAAYWAVHLILTKVKANPSVKLSNLIALISAPVDDLDFPVVEKLYLGK